MRLTSRSMAVGLLVLAAMTHALAASAEDGGPTDPSGGGGAGGSQACNTQVPGVCESATPDPTACGVSRPGHPAPGGRGVLGVLGVVGVIGATRARRRPVHGPAIS